MGLRRGISEYVNATMFLAYRMCHISVIVCIKDIKHMSSIIHLH